MRLISQMTLLISKIYRVWFLKSHFWFPKFVVFDFSNNTFDFQNLMRLDFSIDTFDLQNLSRLISQMTLLISKIRRILISQMTLLISQIKRVLISQMTLLISQIKRVLISQLTLSISKISPLRFFKWHFDFQNFSQLGVAPLFDEFTRDLWLFCSLLVFGCHVRPRNLWKWYVLLWNLVTIMYVYCSMFYVSLQLFDTIKIRVRKETLLPLMNRIFVNNNLPC